MNPFWSETLRALSPYVPGEQSNAPDLIKLNTNESPYPPSPRVLEALQATASADLRLYPDPEALALKTTIADRHGLKAANVFVGNGSDEVLAHTFFALLKHPEPLLFPDITYSFYPVYCSLYGIEAVRIPLDDTLRINPDDYARTNGGIIVPNPNAPTGIALGIADLRRLLTKNPTSVVVVDEAYVDFGADSAVTLVQEYPQLLVVQTLSKSRSLAGLRVGFAMGDSALIEALELVKGCFNSYPLDRFAQAGAIAALDDEAYFREITARTVDTREALRSALLELGFEVAPSAANFLFVRHPARRGAELHAALRERQILVRHFNQERIADHLRITIGTASECDALVGALQEILRA